MDLNTRYLILQEVLEFMYNVNKKYEVKNEEYVREIFINETKLWGEDLTQYILVW